MSRSSKPILGLEGRRAKEVARLTATVDLPTPPLPLATRMTLFTFGIWRFVGGGGRRINWMFLLENLIIWFYLWIFLTLSMFWAVAKVRRRVKGLRREKDVIEARARWLPLQLESWSCLHVDLFHYSTLDISLCRDDLSISHPSTRREWRISIWPVHEFGRFWTFGSQLCRLKLTFEWRELYIISEI